MTGMDVTEYHSACKRSSHSQVAGVPQSDGVLNNTVRIQIRDYRQIYTDSPDPIAFLPVFVNTSGRVYDDFTRLFFLHTHREASILSGELPEESEQFRFLRTFTSLFELLSSVSSS